MSFHLTKILHDPNPQKPSKIFPLSSSSSTSMAISLRFTPPSPFSPQHPYNFHSTQFPHNPLPFRQHSRRITPKALTEWREYEQAVKDKDLGKALRFLQDIPQVNDFQSELVELQRDWEVLDTCLNADDMRLVASAYVFLKDKGFLNQYGKYRSIVLEGPRDVTPTVLKSATGLEVSKLSPKKFGLSTSSSIVLVAFFAGLSYLVDHGVDLRPQLAAVLGLSMVDSIFLGGSCLAQISSYWPPYKRRILVHEAGHLLVAYLMGCPIRGVILDPIVAMQMGIQGQAGTQFWDENLQNELAEGRLTGVAFDRYCMVLFGGIAAEALVYGEAEGGENDENLFRSICLLLEPPLSVAQMSNQARWSVLQSYNLLKWHKNAHRAAVKALENGGSLSVVIRSIEEAMTSYI
ncbi:putative peptidase M41 [Helianthus debilis subsp. tardiflorus]